MTQINAQAAARTDWRSATYWAIFLVPIVYGVGLRVVGLPKYVAESGDEWGNAIASFRVLFELGDPNTFIHPSLYYYATAGAYTVLFATLKVAGVTAASGSMTDLFVTEPRWFLYAARTVSVLAAVLSLGAVYAFSRALWGSREGLIAAALVAVLPLHVFYSRTVRVDGLFVLCFVIAFYHVVRVAEGRDRGSYWKAGFWTGVATGANYNGGLLGLWLVAAHLVGRRSAPTLDAQAPGAGWPLLAGSLGLSVATFFASSPFTLLSFDAFLSHFVYQSGLSLVTHVGWEERAFSSYYVYELAREAPYCLALIGVSTIATVLFGTRAERFAISMPIGYVIVFSLMRTKDVRFILPALTLFVTIAAALPHMLSRLLASWACVRPIILASAFSLLAACLATMAQKAIPLQSHDVLGDPSEQVLAWIEGHVAPGSTIVVESSVVRFLGTLQEPGRFAESLRRSIIATRPNLDHDYVLAVFVGGRTYDPAAVIEGRVHYAIVRKRNIDYIERQCGTYPDVCAFYQALRDHGAVAFETSSGIEPVAIYQITRGADGSASAPHQVL